MREGDLGPLQVWVSDVCTQAFASQAHAQSGSRRSVRRRRGRAGFRSSDRARAWSSCDSSAAICSGLQPPTNPGRFKVWFGIVDRQAIRRGVFTSVKDLNARIRAFITGWNDRKHPFVWTKTTEDILKKTQPKTN